MDEHERLLKNYGRALGGFLARLLVLPAGLPRPIIGLNDALPVVVPVNQETVREFQEFVRDSRKEFAPATIVLHVQGYNDPYHRKTAAVAYPYADLTNGEVVTLEEGMPPVRLARVVIQDVPPEWRSLKPLELLLQAQAKHVRHGVALGVGPTIPLRVPRQEIPGKATGV